MQALEAVIYSGNRWQSKLWFYNELLFMNVGFYHCSVCVGVSVPMYLCIWCVYDVWISFRWNAVAMFPLNLGNIRKFRIIIILLLLIQILIAWEDDNWHALRSSARVSTFRILQTIINYLLSSMFYACFQMAFMFYFTKRFPNVKMLGVEDDYFFASLHCCNGKLFIENHPLFSTLKCV